MKALGTSILIGLILVAGVSATAGSLVCEQFEVRMNRLYFPVGEESHVYANSRYVVTREIDTVVRGRIEHAWQGVSITGVLDSLAIGALTADTDLVALLETAEVDSAVELRLGCDNTQLRQLRPDNDSAQIEIVAYELRTAMMRDFQMGRLDGILTLSEPSAECRSAAIRSHGAPFVAALIPNVGRPANGGGLLTTSLYYRYRDARQFGGDQPIERHRLNSFDQSLFGLTDDRPYEFNSERGRALFARIDNRPLKMRLFVGDESLNRLGLYFADIVSRDRWPIEIVDREQAADVYLDFVPVSASLPSVTMYHLFRWLVRDSVAGSPANEHLRRIDAAFDFVEKPQLPGDYYRNLSTAERIMTEDLGVYCLFQPRVFLAIARSVQGVTFDDDGNVDITNAVRVTMPVVSEVAP